MLHDKYLSENSSLALLLYVSYFFTYFGGSVYEIFFYKLKLWFELYLKQKKLRDVQQEREGTIFKQVFIK